MSNLSKTNIQLAFLSIFVFVTNEQTFSQCISGDCKNGKGLYKIAEGVTYEGDFKNELPNGEGKLIRTNGSRYEGSFVNGIYSGYGKLTYANGNVYTGQFREGMYHGSGTLKRADVTTETGTFFNNSLENGKPNPNPMSGMNFYSSTGFNRIGDRGGRFDSKNNLIYADETPFSMNTGRKIIETADSKQNETLPDNLQHFLEKKKYDDYRLLKKGEDCILLGGPEKGKSNKKYFEVYKVTPDEKVEKLMRINVAYDFRGQLPIVFSADHQLAFLDGRIYSTNNSEGVYVAESSLNTGWYTSKCFSANNDTLYNVYHDVDPYQTEFRYEYSTPNDDGIVISKFDTKTGKRFDQKAYFSKRLNNFYKGYRLAAFDFNTGKALVYFDLFVTYFNTNGNGYGFKKAAIVDINDLDYMLPLRNPEVTEAYFVQKEKEVNADFRGYLTDKKAAIERKQQKARLTDDDEEGFVEERKPLINPNKKTTVSTSAPTTTTGNKDDEQHKRNMDEIQRSIERQQNKDDKKKNH